MSAPLSPRAAALIDWYRREHRPLPWRSTDDPYRILLSEVMLQQTQVDRVVPRYERFLTRFPTIEALAAAPLADVLDEWSGLGYNGRAKRLHDAATAVAVMGWPTTPEALQELSGVGPYTAAAVASFAFGARVAAIDTNVRRVLSRWEGRPLSGAALRTAAAAVLPDDAATWNQAMMELGATRCRPRTPLCGRCPVSTWCADPTVTVAIRRQPRFEGSRRQTRGALVRALREGPRTLDQLSDIPGGTDEVRSALTDLRREGLVTDEDGRWALPGR